MRRNLLPSGAGGKMEVGGIYRRRRKQGLGWNQMLYSVDAYTQDHNHMMMAEQLLVLQPQKQSEVMSVLGV